ncbi:4-hydroxy-tetrahydrodipicolinate synthase [Endozoicomonas sp. GU-1]|uniref:4-hydroxy-tetrahydrodipicolinate synthase n=1 Tax=Endozoicomonas sp. GU-1 TaxID=3009078 RepID=UPI0022B49BE6|nr:4-hydroxy-tetrahydrodipicolinate synthase [Endozoicomonas sp. GU-1]WBA80136.1 4-hydroxy-tetrahydrodipicolinate synthase [Endozoicomonas sp. GU-1]WBA87710.1 4-hydroxy-tetrahydrodipicolinate synthase [Endozoicomonas sp. GU-1]
MITGSLVAIVTPMYGNGELDWESMHALVEHHIDQGTDGIVVVGTTGESATLTVQEHCEAIKRMVDQVNGRIPVIAGTGANSTAEAVHLTAEAKALGVDACLLVTPYYNKPTQEGLYLHYQTVAESVAIPQILYNVPGRTAVDLLPGTIGRLSQLDNIVGVKEATGIVERGQQIRALCGADFAIYSGDDATGMELMLQGANGVISVVNNVAPKIMHELCVAATAGDRSTAEALNARIEALSRQLFLEANPIPVKWALKEMGMIKDGIRLPLTPLSECYHSDVRSALQKAGLI